MQNHLLIQDYLRSGKTLIDLEKEHGVKSNCLNGKIGLNYDQIEAKESDPLAQQCRGLILEEGTYNVIACPFFRFFNMEQTSVAANVDFSNARILEKLDGTMAVVYFYKDKWFIGTRGRCEADAAAHDSGFTFSKLFDICCQEMAKRSKLVANGIQDLMRDADRNCTYIFEITSPVNRIVCNYEDFNLTLLGVRSIITLEEDCPDNHLIYFSNFGLKTPKQYHFNNVNHMIQVIREWDPKDHEGVVVVDNNFNRVKVKNPAYLCYNKMRDSLSTSIRGCIEVILLGKDDDLIGMLPNFITNRITELKKYVTKIINQTEEEYSQIKDIENMKEFALIAQTKLWPAALFAMKRRKANSVKDYILGKNDSISIDRPMLDTMFELCKKINPGLEII